MIVKKHHVGHLPKLVVATVRPIHAFTGFTSDSVARDMLHCCASSGNVHGFAGSLNIADSRRTPYREVLVEYTT